MEDTANERSSGRLKGIFLKYRVELCVLIAFVSWMLLIVYQAHQTLLLSQTPQWRGGAPLKSLTDALVFMMVDTNIMYLILFLFPLSYILLVFGMGRRYDSIKTVPNKYEAAFGIAICILSFFMRYVTTLVKPGTGDYGITDYMVFLVGISYLFFGYEKFRGISRLLSGVFGSGETEKVADREAGDKDAGHRGEKKKSRLALTWELIARIDIVFWFILVMEIVYVVYQSKFFESELMRRLQPFEASLTSNILHLFGYPVTSGGITGDMVTVVGLHGASSFWIDWGCTGILSITIYSLLGSALILTVPAKPWKKGVCIVGGIIVLFFSNILRLITIFLLAYYYDSKTALDFHTYSGYVFFLVFAGIFWFISLSYFLVEKKKDRPRGGAEKIVDGKLPEAKIAGAKKFTLDVGWVFATIVVSSIVGMILKVMLGNHYPTDDFGLYTLLLVLYMLVYTVGELGVSATVTKLVAEVKNDEKAVRRYASTAFSNALIYGLLLAIVVFALADPIAGMYHFSDPASTIRLRDMLRIVAFLFPFLTLNNAIIGVFNGLRQMEKYGICGIFRRVIVVFYTAAFMYMKFDINGAVIAIVLAEASNFILALYFGRSLFFPPDNSRFRDMTKKMWEYSPAVVALNFVGQIGYRIDVMILPFFSDPTIIGIYGVAIFISWLPPMIPKAMQSITFPMISGYSARNNKKSIERLVNLCIKYSLILMIITSLVIVFLGKQIISFMFHDPEFLNAYQPMIILTCGLIIYGMLTSIGSAFFGIGKPTESLKISLLLVLPSSIIGCLILIPGRGIIPGMGMNGAALAIAISYTLGSLCYLISFSRHAEINIIWKDVGIIMLLALFSGFCGYFIILLKLGAFTAFAVCIIVFLLCIIQSGIIPKDEWKVITALPRSLFKKG